MNQFDVVVVGASFGGPKAIEAMLPGITRHLPVPIVICQHITPGMTEIWADRLNKLGHLRVAEGVDDARLEKGRVYIVPAGLQARVERDRLTSTPMLRLDPDFADSLHVPSIDILFSSAARAFGSRVLSVLLTGMGTDGSGGTVAVRNAGGYTIAESEETALSYSMPGSAVAAGAVVQELGLAHIGRRLSELCGAY
jgi:two-component system chemotaxis response regulator CheB